MILPDWLFAQLSQGGVRVELAARDTWSILREGVPGGQEGFRSVLKISPSAERGDPMA